MSGLKKILKNCDNKVKDRIFSMFWWSLFSTPEKIYSLIFDEFQAEECSEVEFKEFLQVCDNRLDMSKSLLYDLSMIFSAIFVSFAVIASVLTITQNGDQMLSDIILHNYLLAAFTILLFIFLVLILICIGYIRTQLYAWASFKEIALILRIEIRQESEK